MSAEEEKDRDARAGRRQGEDVAVILSEGSSFWEPEGLREKEKQWSEKGNEGAEDRLVRVHAQ